jgi:hypothetical protein
LPEAQRSSQHRLRQRTGFAVAVQSGIVTKVVVKLDLPDRLASKARQAGLLEPIALRELLREAVRRRAAAVLLSGAARATAAGSRPLSMREIQATVATVRRSRARHSPAA